MRIDAYAPPNTLELADVLSKEGDSGLRYFIQEPIQHPRSWSPVIVADLEMLPCKFQLPLAADPHVKGGGNSLWIQKLFCDHVDLPKFRARLPLRYCTSDTCNS